MSNFKAGDKTTGQIRGAGEECHEGNMKDESNPYPTTDHDGAEFTVMIKRTGGSRRHRVQNCCRLSASAKNSGRLWEYPNAVAL
jgi:hypothetical protein